MLKACTLFKRKPGLSVEEYQSYWRTGHVPFIKAMKQVRRYIQNHPIFTPGTEPAFDGLVELWVDSVEDLKAMAASPEYARVVEDEKVFVDRSSIQLVLTDEHVITDGPREPDGVKHVFMLKRKSGMTPSEFQDYWLKRHAPLVGNPPGLIRYVQSHAKLGGYRDGKEPAWDGIGTISYTSLEAMKAARKAPGQDKVRDDAVNFTDPSRLTTFITREWVMIA